MPETPCGRQSDMTDAEWLLLFAFPARPAPMRPASEVGDARDCQRDLLRPVWPDCLEPAAEAFSTMTYGVSLVCPIPRRRHLEADQPSPGDARPREGGSRGQSDGGRDRQPKRQDDREWRHAGLRFWKEDQGPQAPRHGRYRRPSAYVINKAEPYLVMPA